MSTTNSLLKSNSILKLTKSKAKAILVITNNFSKKLQISKSYISNRNRERLQRKEKRQKIRLEQIKTKKRELNNKELSKEEKTLSKNNYNNASRETYSVEEARDYIDSRVVVEENNNTNKLEQASIKLNTKRKSQITSSLDTILKRI